MRIIKFSSITFLFLCLTFGTMVSCDGDGEDIVIEEIVRAEISFSPFINGRFAIDNLTFNPTLTFDEPEFTPAGPINGKTVQGVTFLFDVGGLPSDDATVGITTGPGFTPLLSPPLMEGDDAGVLTLLFNPPATSISFDFALNDIFDIPDAVTINIFDADDNPIGTASADATVPPLFLFAEGTLAISTNGQPKSLEKMDSTSNSDSSSSESDW